MGEVRVPVTLTNAVDLGLVRRNVMPLGEVRTYQASGLVDTGCISLVLPSHVADRLGLSRITRRVARYADGRREEVDATEPILVEIMGRSAISEGLVLGDTVLIGQTILEQVDLHVDCREQRLLPNPDSPDQPVLRV